MKRQSPWKKKLHYCIILLIAVILLVSGCSNDKTDEQQKTIPAGPSVSFYEVGKINQYSASIDNELITSRQLSKPINSDSQITIGDVIPENAYYRFAGVKIYDSQTIELLDDIAITQNDTIAITINTTPYQQNHKHLGIRPYVSIQQNIFTFIPTNNVYWEIEYKRGTQTVTDTIMFDSEDSPITYIVDPLQSYSIKVVPFGGYDIAKIQVNDETVESNLAFEGIVYNNYLPDDSAQTKSYIIYANGNRDATFACDTELSYRIQAPIISSGNKNKTEYTFYEDRNCTIRLNIGLFRFSEPQTVYLKVRALDNYAGIIRVLPQSEGIIEEIDSGIYIDAKKYKVSIEGDKDFYWKLEMGDNHTITVRLPDKFALNYWVDRTQQQSLPEKNTHKIQNMPEGTRIMISIPESQGKTLLTPSASGIFFTPEDNGAYSFIMPAKDITITFGKNDKVIIPTKTTPGGTVTYKNKNQAIIPSGEAVIKDKEYITAIANPDEHYAIKSWESSSYPTKKTNKEYTFKYQVGKNDFPIPIFEKQVTIDIYIPPTPTGGTITYTHTFNDKERILQPGKTYSLEVNSKLNIKIIQDEQYSISVEDHKELGTVQENKGLWETLKDKGLLETLKDVGKDVAERTINVVTPGQAHTYTITKDFKLPTITFRKK